MLRVIRPELVRNFAEGHNAGLWRCLAQILPASTGPIAKATVSLRLSMGGLGLRDASRTSEPAFWASWADCLSGEAQVHENHFHQKNFFIKNHFHQKPLSSKTTFNKKPLSSKTTFIKNHFHQKPLSSKTIFIKNHFHQKPISSKTNFIRDHFHQKPFLSKTNFIKNQFHQSTSCQRDPPPEQK